MSTQQDTSNPTSNDLLLRLDPGHSPSVMNYKVVAQSVFDMHDIQNAPAVSMGPYLLATERSRLLTIISIYSLRGESTEQARLLYMNAAALRIWEEMGKNPKIIGSQFRPPHTSLLAFGVPFSE